VLGSNWNLTGSLGDNVGAKVREPGVGDAVETGYHSHRTSDKRLGTASVLSIKRHLNSIRAILRVGLTGRCQRCPCFYLNVNRLDSTGVAVCACNQQVFGRSVSTYQSRTPIASSARTASTTPRPLLLLPKLSVLLLPGQGSSLSRDRKCRVGVCRAWVGALAGGWCGIMLFLPVLVGSTSCLFLLPSIRFAPCVRYPLRQKTATSGSSRFPHHRGSHQHPIRHFSRDCFSLTAVRHLLENTCTGSKSD